MTTSITEQQPEGGPFCTACGVRSRAGAGFCTKCGTALGVNEVLPSPGNVARSRPRMKRRSPLSRRARLVRLFAVVAVGAVLGVAYWWVNRPPGRYEPDNAGLYPIVENGKTGYMDPAGQIRISPQFDAGETFAEGLAGVMIGGKLGYIDTKGRVVITPRFTDGTTFAYGRAAVKLCCGTWFERHPGDRYGFIDRSGQLIGTQEFTWVGIHFSGNRFAALAPVSRGDGLVGFIGRDGSDAIPPSFRNTWPWGFAEGTIAAQQDGSEGKWGFIDRHGSWVVEPQFDNAAPFDGGLAAVEVSHKWGFIDSRGQFVINPTFDGAVSFGDAKTTLVQTGNLWSPIDRTGKVVGTATYLDAKSVSQGLRPIKTEVGWGYLDGNAQIAIPATYDTVEDFAGGLARVRVGRREAYIDLKGAYVGNPFKGLTTTPRTPVREVWEGSVVNGKYTSRTTFLLTRAGTTISGYRSDSALFSLGGRILTEVSGTVGSDGSVAVDDGFGQSWTGRFSSPEVIVGSIAGKTNSVQGLRFRLHVLRDAGPGDFPDPMSPTSADWISFEAQFRAAAASRNQSALAAMIDTRSFSLQEAALPTLTSVFQVLNWSWMDGLLLGVSASAGPGQMTIVSPTQCGGQLVFIQDRSKQWRWSGYQDTCD